MGSCLAEQRTEMNFDPLQLSQVWILAHCLHFFDVENFFLNNQKYPLNQLNIFFYVIFRANLN